MPVKINILVNTMHFTSRLWFLIKTKLTRSSIYIYISRILNILFRRIYQIGPNTRIFRGRGVSPEALDSPDDNDLWGPPYPSWVGLFIRIRRFSLPLIMGG